MTSQPAMSPPGTSEPDGAPLPGLQIGSEIRSDRLERVMTSVWLDKAGALVLIIQALWSMVDAYRRHSGLEMILWLVAQTLMVGFAIFRTRPTRVTTNPINWLIEAAAFGSWFLYWTVREGGSRQLVPSWLTGAIAVIGLIVLVSARLSLARSFGYLPAQREIRVAGIYQFVRHPIYVAILLNGIALLLNQFSLMMIIAVFVNNFFFLLKALIEESYLGSHSPEYRAYMQRVRWRYIPFVF